MKLTTKTRYGLRALVDLALNGQQGHQPLSAIASRQKISPKYLEAEFSMLRQAGLVKSIRGAQGGYSLARPAEMIRLDEVIRALEGDLSIVDEPIDEAASTIRRLLHETVYGPVSLAIATHLEGMTLKDLIRDCDAGQGTRPSDQDV